MSKEYNPAKLELTNSEPITNTDLIAPQAVDIKIEKLENRQRRVFAKIQIPYSLEQVWQVLTDYEAFTEFMPNFTQSRRLAHPTGGIRLEQVRTKSFMGMKVSTKLVVDIEENFPSKIHYQQVEGDFKNFSGYWQLKPWNLSLDQDGVELSYNFLIWPKPILPGALVEHVLSHDIPVSMLAIRKRIEKLFSRG